MERLKGKNVLITGASLTLNTVTEIGTVVTLLPGAAGPVSVAVTVTVMLLAVTIVSEAAAGN